MKHNGVEIEEYSTATGVTYPTWDALVEAESNGWLCVAIISNGKETWPWVEGPFPEKRLAIKTRQRLRTKWKREQWKHPGQTYQFFIRPAWRH